MRLVCSDGGKGSASALLLSAGGEFGDDRIWRDVANLGALKERE